MLEVPVGELAEEREQSHGMQSTSVKPHGGQADEESATEQGVSAGNLTRSGKGGRRQPRMTEQIADWEHQRTPRHAEPARGSASIAHQGNTSITTTIVSTSMPSPRRRTSAVAK